MHLYALTAMRMCITKIIIIYESALSLVELMLEAPDFQDLCLALDPMLQAELWVCSHMPLNLWFD